MIVDATYEMLSAQPRNRHARPKAPLKVPDSLHAVTMTPDQAEPQQSTAEEDERGGFWHFTPTSEVAEPVRNGAENKNGVASDTTVAPGGSGSRGIEVGHESARHKARRSAAEGGVAEGEGKDVADAGRSGRRTLLERDRLGRRRETPWCEPSAREAMSNRSAGRAFGNRARLQVVQTCL